MIENKEVMARNIKKQMEIKGVNSADVCRALNFKTNTFSNWINAKIYPRIDKIEMLADYFGVSKAALVEDVDYEAVSLNSDEKYVIEAMRENNTFHERMLLYAQLMRAEKRSEDNK